MSYNDVDLSALQTFYSIPDFCNNTYDYSTSQVQKGEAACPAVLSPLVA